MKLHNVPQDSPVGKMVAEIEAICTERGLTLSRWQANKAGNAVTVTYIAHTGERAAQARYQNGIAADCTISQMEGTTERCEAYRRLSALRKELRA